MNFWYDESDALGEKDGFNNLLDCFANKSNTKVNK